ncbi:TetR/AcrR family transcriptional regulator [Octadecabacter sp. R77987]|uniref:TetR/AcrR family transcriptional regulator n=1 Tax=Octadecabacter sp. R77987 TaxID=3093874 RepID=UPI00366F1D46
MNTQTPAEELRHKAVLGAAYQAFISYGFRKTSMDEIAQRAGLSRPALYQYFRNKDDIARQLLQAYYDTAAQAVSAALADDGPCAQVLERALHAQGGGVIEPVFTSAHGRELLDASTQLGADIKQTGEARLAAIYADWLKKGDARGRIGLHGQPPDQIAATLLGAAYGIKMSADSYASYTARLSQLARMIGAGLAAAATP